ncbi:YfaZ family outer membrane protein [Chromobacterium haemolyticum]|uniref:YfaZ family outer membrane protein n=1 Tax=Chromobacterium haemolyticum TaxID=394935 RepID=UPI0002D28C74|nr:YfaZ family outer membrane protein [Chromobacterium haemolyticum]
MKTLQLGATAALLSLAAAAAHAADYSFIAGKDFQQFSRTPQGLGLGLSIDYLNSDHKGNAGGAGLEFAIPLGPVTLAGGGKLMSLNPDSGSGTAALLGGRANIQLAPKVSFYGQAYYAGDSMASGSVKNVSDLAAGVRWNPIGPFTVEAGYRYFDIERKDGNRNRRLADGMYIGAGFTF